MDSKLPATGTAQFLALVSPYVPDTFINDSMPRHRGRGRRRQFSPAQLYRIHLLSVLTPVHAFNQLVRLLPEQRAWRRFAHLANRRDVPDVWMLNQFRERAGVSGLRQINEQLLEPLLPKNAGENLSLALIDATDLEAACSGHKKRPPGSIRRRAPRWERERSNAGRAVSLSDTRSTPFGSGCSAISEACCWCRWSVGRRQPITARAVSSSRA
jgi:hypothetical protein